MPNSSTSRTGLWIILALLAFPVFAAFWFGFVSPAPLPIDVWWHDHVGVADKSFAYYFTVMFHLLGSTKGMAVVTAIVLLVLIIRKKWWHAITMAATMATVLVAVKVIKLLVDRPRPEDMMVLETETSFPSGHSLGAGAIAGVLVCFALANQKLARVEKIIIAALGVAYVLLMMWSRTALHVHWFSDTVAGALLGTILAVFFSRLFLPKARAAEDLESARHSSETGRHS